MKKNLLFIQRLLIVFVFFLFCTISAHAQDWNQIIKATAGDRNKLTEGQLEDGTSFGSSVAISGDYAFVGSALGVYIFKYTDGKWQQIKKFSLPEEYIGSVDVSGDYLIVETGIAAYIYRKDPGGADDWFLVKKLIGLNDDVGGTVVAIDGDYAVVGTPNVNLDGTEENSITAAGSAYIFKKDQGGADNWGQIKIITAPVPVINDHFGGKVAISGDHIIVGSYSAALIYRCTQGGADNWGLVKNITSSAPAGENSLYTVAIDGDYAVVGNPAEIGEGNHIDAGAAYIFKKGQETGNWFQVQKFRGWDSDHAFGSAVAIDGDYIAVGAPGYGYEYNGTIFTFKKDPESPNQWIAQNPVPLELPRFGHLGSNLAISGGVIIAGYPNASDGDEIRVYGLAYTFQKDQGGPEAWGTQQTLQLSKIVTGDSFGYRVAISGNYAVVGVPYEDADANGLGYVSAAGAAYIFVDNSGEWQQVKKITSPVRMGNAMFGMSISIENDYVIVGAPFPNPQDTEGDFPPGSAYVFQKDEGGIDNWGLVKQLTIGGPEDYNVQFSFSVSISGNYAIVGAPIETNPMIPGGLGTNAGSVYIFEKNIGGNNNWGMLKKVTASVSRAGDHFGAAISISGDYFIVSAPNESHDALESNEIYNSGSAYIFQKDSGGPGQWGQIKKVTSATRVFNDQFGYSLYLNGNYAIVSTYNGTGSATIFRKDVGGANNWGLIKTLINPGTTNELFGRSVSISGDFAVVGASAAAIDGMVNAGAAYLYSKDQDGQDQWGQTRKIIASVSTAGDLFGYAVAISGNSMIVGAPGDDEDESEANPLSNAGSVYIFRNGSPLPVTLATFEAAKSENTAILQWTTSAETNTDHFEILRSTDAKSWEVLGHVEAAKESTELLSYTFTDYKPAAGENFYRLKMLDQDGSFTYSRIRNVSFDINGNITLYPNPVSERLFFTDTELDKIESVSMINVLGQIVVQISKPTKEGIAIHQLSAGMYLVQVKRKNGTMQMNEILVAR